MNYEEFTTVQQKAIEKFRKMIVNRTDTGVFQILNNTVMFHSQYYESLFLCIGYFFGLDFESDEAQKMAQFCAEKNYFIKL